MRATSTLLLAMACVGSTFAGEIVAPAEPRHLQFGEAVAGSLVGEGIWQAGKYVEQNAKWGVDNQEEDQDQLLAQEDTYDDRRRLAEGVGNGGMHKHGGKHGGKHGKHHGKGGKHHKHHGKGGKHHHKHHKACKDNDAALTKYVKGASCTTAKMMNMCTQRSMRQMARKFCPKTCNMCHKKGGHKNHGSKTCKDKSKRCGTSKRVSASSCKGRIKNYCCATCAKKTGGSSGGMGGKHNHHKTCTDRMSQCAQYASRCKSRGIKRACCKTCSTAASTGKGHGGSKTCKADRSKRCSKYAKMCSRAKVRNYCCKTCAAAASGGSAGNRRLGELNEEPL